jgi:hypothetical protein
MKEPAAPAPGASPVSIRAGKVLTDATDDQICSAEHKQARRGGEEKPGEAVFRAPSRGHRGCRAEDPATADRDLSGYYAQAGFVLPGKVGVGRLQLAGRYEAIDPERGSSTVEARLSLVVVF